ncbi:MAG: hypothetical protein ACF788_03825 [Novipirellula sp. JB048]
MSDSARLQPSVRYAWFVYLAVTIIVVLLASFGFSTSAGVVAVFGRWDVLACGFFAALPFSMWVASSSIRLRGWQQGVIAAGLLGVGLVVAIFAAAIVQLPDQSDLGLAFCRGVIAAAMITAVVLLTASVLPEPRLPVPAERSWGMGLMAAALLFLIPAAYADAVAEGIRLELEQSLDSRRFALANRQVARYAQLKSSGQVQGKSIQRVRRELDEIVLALTREAERPLPADASLSELGRRITVLMHLDRNRQALQWIEPLTHGPRFHPVSLDYKALCYQRLGQLPESMQAYQDCLAYWKTQPEGDARRSGLASAFKGIGFAARRLNQRRLEETAYRELVAVAPTAESHFLLAQCYREHQKTRLAAAHAAKAIELDPGFAAQSQTMLSSMSTDHFGCLQVPRH